MTDHKSQCEARFNTGHLPECVRSALYQHVYDEGHARGMSEVEARYEDLAELVIASFRAGRMSVAYDLRKSYVAATDEHATARDIANNIIAGRDL